MKWMLTAARRYPVVALTLVLGAVGGVLEFLDAGTAARWLLSGYALLVAARGAWDMIRDVMKGKWGIDVLAVMAIIATVSVGEYWASLLIVLMLSGGEALEDFAAGRAKRELSSLLDRAPRSAHILTGVEDTTQEVPVDHVRIGDRILVRPSELVPVDGVLASPAGSFDESSLTGESLPVEKQSGDSVLSGSLNGQRAVVVEATAVSADSQYQRIVALVAEAAESQAPTVRLADRFAVPFTLLSLAIAGAAWLISGDPSRFAEVLVVATPCPLLIAAPVAFMGGMSRAAKQGIIVKGGGTLEQLARATTVAFDKTGTLSYGNPTVAEVRPSPSFTEDELFSLVASAEVYSSHVLASAIVQAATDRALPLVAASIAREEATNGVAATIADREVVVGKFAFVSSHAPDAVETDVTSGELSVYVAVDGRYAGAVLLRDRVRDNAGETLAKLRRLGVTNTLMLTGDAVATAQHAADQLAISQVHAALLPADKVEIVRSLPHRPVIMVGDGVNDAPVLAVAEVGIAMGAKGATAASEAADVVIMLDDLSKTADAVAIGHRTMRVALQSIWLGIALSIGLMVLAALGFLPAIVGAALQELVDLATILNALRALGSGTREPGRRTTGPEANAPGPVVSDSV